MRNVGKEIGSHGIDQIVKVNVKHITTDDGTWTGGLNYNQKANDKSVNIASLGGSMLYLTKPYSRYQWKNAPCGSMKKGNMFHRV